MARIQINSIQRDTASFRDPSGFVYEQDGVIYRKINPLYMPQYKHLMGSGLYESLIKAKLMVSHEEVETNEGGMVIRPERIPYISYPYEWCFEQYKDAALTTLRIQLLALQFGMTLKDAAAYNIQFTHGRPRLIDTLSFDMYAETPWTAYGQFCRHFLAPLMLMTYIDQRLVKMTQSHIDGIPLDLADCILRGKGGFAAFQHIHLHAGAVKSYGEAGKKEGEAIRLTMKKHLHISMIDSLMRIIERLKLKNKITEWGNYYSLTNYEEAAARHKETIVKEYLASITKKDEKAFVWDLGANDGRYSRLALEYGAEVIAFDIDPVAAGRSYLETRKTGSAMLPLVLDLTCPSPAIGFANNERKTIDGRRKPGIILMLAVIHHLAISNNLPLEKIAQWLASLCEYLIIEFVPKEDSQVKILLKTRVDIFPGYNIEGFEAAFTSYFKLCGKTQIERSERTLYLFKIL
jgi:hypothetical protein